jgi:hypothetical protein
MESYGILTHDVLDALMRGMLPAGMRGLLPAGMPAGVLPVSGGGMLMPGPGSG